jgi:bacterioferritin-associated ferredoxin
MIVCVCKAVSDRHIKDAVKGGASCLRDITRELGVGTCCGKCVPEARHMIARSLAAHTENNAGVSMFTPAVAEFAI